MFIPRFPKKETISGWRIASQKGCLLSYFDRADIFGICSGKSDAYLFDYSGDYYDYVRTFPLADRVRFYRTYLTLNSVEIPIKNNSFDDPRYFFSVSERQSAEYERILMSVERSPDDVFYFLGDGVGVGSMISIKNGWKFFSSEIGRVGSMAIRLGIINVIEYKLVEVPKNAILVLLNVEEYLMDDEVEMYSHFFPRVLVVSENRDSRLGAEFVSSDSKIFSRGIVFHHVPVIKPISMTADYLRAREPVMPIDIKSFIYAEGNGISIDPDGFPISYDDNEGAFNIRTRRYPGNITMARKGDMKIYKGVEFKFEEEGQMVMSDSEAFRYYPEDPGRCSILAIGKYREEKDLVVAVVKRPRQIQRYVDEMRVIRPIYYLYSRKVGEKFESYYSKINVGLPGVATGGDYVIRENN